MKVRLGGFSLPEVTIAVAIAALGLVSVLGLIPSGLESVRSAGATATSSRIFQQLSSELQRAEWGDYTGSGVGWSGLAPYQNQLRYFDDQGVELPATTGEGDMRLTYVARVYLLGQAERPAFLPGDTAAGGGTGGTPGAVRKDVCLLRVDVAESTNSGFAFPDPSAAAPANTVGGAQLKLSTRVGTIARLR